MTIGEMAEEIRLQTEWSPTPSPVTSSGWLAFVKQGLRSLYGTTNREDEYDSTWTSASDPGLKLNEERYVLLTAMISFYKKNQDDVSKMIGYTTNALSVTNADKPYANLKDKIAELELERRRIFYKLEGGVHSIEGI